MSAQTSYSRVMANAYPGQLDGAGHDIETALVETAAGVAPGVIVSKGTADDQCVIGGSAPIGAVARRLDVENNSSDTLVFEQYSPAAVVKRGRINVAFSGAVSKGALLNYNTTTGVIGTGVAGAGEKQLRGQLLQTLTGAGVAIIDLEPQYEVPVTADGTGIEGSGITGDTLSLV